MTADLESPTARTRWALVRFGWTSLLVWTFAGLLLEAAHGFKWAPFFASELTRLLLRLAHAHGVGLSLVTLLLSQVPERLFVGVPVRFAWVAALARLAAVTMPVGFAAGAIGHTEADPSPAILLVPLGAAALLCGLGVTVHAAWRGEHARRSPP
jgi:hypothetical protein